MLHFLYILFALFVTLGAYFHEGGTLPALLHLPGVMITFISPLFLAVAATSERAFVLSWKLVVRRQVQTTPKEAEQACAFLRVFGTTSLLMGAIGASLGALAATVSWGEGFLGGGVTVFEVLHHSGSGLVSVLWGTLFKMLCCLAEQSIRSSGSGDRACLEQE